MSSFIVLENRPKLQTLILHGFETKNSLDGTSAVTVGMWESLRNARGPQVVRGEGLAGGRRYHRYLAVAGGSVIFYVTCKRHHLLTYKYVNIAGTYLDGILAILLAVRVARPHDGF